MIKFERIGKIATVSVWKSDTDFNLEDVKKGLKESEKWGNIVEIKDFYIAFTEQIYWQGYGNFLENYEELVKDKQEVVKKAEWIERPDDYLRTIKHIILDEKAGPKKINWKNDLKEFDCEYELKLLNKGIVRRCNFEDGTSKLVAQGAEIFMMYLCKIDEGIIVFNDKLEEGYLYIIHYTKENEKVLLKFWLGKWGWYLFSDKQGRRFLLNNLEDASEYCNKENYKVLKGQLYCD